MRKIANTHSISKTRSKELTDFAMRNVLLIFVLTACAAHSAMGAESLRIPAHTAYIDPDPNGARVSPTGITRWTDPQQKVIWFGDIKTAATVHASVELRVPMNNVSKLRLTIADKSRESEVRGNGTNLVTADFGSFEIKKPGYQRFQLESLNPPNAPAGEIDALVLGGVSTNDTHFNYKTRRNAASVHLTYTNPKGTNIAAY